MAIRIGAIEVVLRTELDQFVGGMRRAASEVDQQGGRITRATGSMASGVTDLERRFRTFDGGVAFRGLELSALRASSQVDRLRNIMLLLPAALGGTAAALGVRQLTDFADEATKVRNRINTVIEGSSQRLAAEEQVFQIAQRTRQEYGATAQLFSRTTQAARGLGRSQGEVLQFVEAVQKTNLISGSTTQEASAAATQLAQGLASNRLQGDELRSILENNVALSQILAQELAGGSVGKLREMGTSGELTAQAVIDAVLRRQEEINRRFNASSPLISQGLTYLNNALIRYVGIVDQAYGASERLGEFLRWIGDNVPGIAAAILGLGAALTTLAALRFARAGVGGLFGGIRGEVGRTKHEAFTQREAANAAMVAAKQAQGEARRQVQVAERAYQTASSGPVLANANPMAVQRLSEAETRLANARKQVADADARIATLQSRRAALQRDLANVRPNEAFYRAAFNLSGAQAEVQRGNQLLESARQVRAQFEAEAAKSAGASGSVVAQGMAAYAKASAQVERQVVEDNVRRAASLRNAERAFSVQSNKVSGQEARIIENAARIDQEIARATSERQRAGTGVVVAAGAVTQARGSAEAAAEQRLAEMKKVSAAASERLQQANLAVARTIETAGAAQSRFVAVSSTLGMVKTGLLSSATSLAAFLGGPWGIAFAVASAALGVFAYRQARAAEEAARHKRALEGLPEAIRAVEEARQAATAGRPQQQAELDARERLKEAEAARRSRTNTALDEARRLLGGNRGVFNALQEAGAVPDGERLPASGRLSVMQNGQMLDFLERLRREGALTEEQLNRLWESFSARGIRAGDTSANDLVNSLNAARDAARQVRELREGAQRLAAENTISRSLEGEPFAAAQIEARRRSVKEMSDAITAAKATADAAAPSFKALAEEVMRPLTEGATGFDLAQRTGISEQAKTAVQEYTAAMGQLRLAAAALPDGPIRDLVQSFVTGTVPLGEFKSRLEEIQRANPDLGGVVRGLLETADNAGRGRDRVDALQKAINALTGKTIDIILRVSQIQAGTPDAQEADGLAPGRPTARANANLALVQAHHRAEEELRRSRQSKREYGMEDIARRLGISVNDPRVAEIYDNNNTSRGGGQAARDAKAYARTLRELREEASSFNLNDVDRETVRYARTAKVAEADVRAFIEAMAAGRTNDISPRIRAIREELERLNGLRLQKEFRDRYATDDERYAKELKRLQQAGFDEQTFQTMRGRLARSIFGDPGGDMAKGFTDLVKSFASGDWEGGLKGLGRRFINVLVDVLFKPLERQLADLFRSIFDGILGQGGGGGLFSGLFTGLQGLLGGLGGGAPVLSPFTSYHGGGTAGSGPVAGLAPASFWNSAPRYHSGLRSGELRAVLQHGERVLTQADSERSMRTMTGLARAAQGGGAAAGARINIINQGPTQPQVSENSDGSIDVLIPAIESALASRAARREGTLYTAMGQTLGAPGNGGLRGL